MISAVIYGLYGVYSRFLGASFGSFSQSWVRSFIVLVILCVLLLAKKFEWTRIERKDIKWFLIWILPASIQPVITFIAFNHLPLATAYFLIYSTMILGGVMSGKIFFSEKFTFMKIISLLSVFTGLLLIYGTDIGLVSNIYVVLALVSGLLVGFWNTLTKKVSGKYSEFQMMTLDQLVTMIVCGIGAFFFKESLPPPSNMNGWFWIFVFAVSGVITVFLLIRGFKYVEAQVGSLILPMEIVFASIFGLKVSIPNSVVSKFASKYLIVFFPTFSTISPWFVESLPICTTRVGVVPSNFSPTGLTPVSFSQIFKRFLHSMMRLGNSFWSPSRTSNFKYSSLLFSPISFHHRLNSFCLWACVFSVFLPNSWVDRVFSSFIAVLNNFGT